MTRAFLLATGALVFAGCASSQTNREPAVGPAGDEPQGRDQMMGQREMHAMCPMSVEGTTVHAEDVEGGGALSFTTTGDVTELRRRVARLAEMHDPRQSTGGRMRGPGPKERGPHGAGMMGGQRRMMAMIPADARVEEIEGGARIVLKPRDPEQLGALREHVQRRAERMASGQCPMMSVESPQAPAPDDPSEHDDHHPGGASD